MTMSENKGDLPDQSEHNKTDTADNANAKPEVKSGVKRGVKKSLEIADKANATMDSAGQVLNAIKWVSIAIVCMFILFVGYFFYKVVSKPVELVGDVVGGASGAVSSGVDKVKDGAVGVLDRLTIPAPNPKAFNKQSDRAFDVLNSMPVQKPESIAERVFWKTNFSDSENKVCRMEMDFGSGKMVVLSGADNKSYATAKSLGGKGERLFRILLRTPADDVGFSIRYEAEPGWGMYWKKTTISKPISDELAAARIMDVLDKIPDLCPKNEKR